VKTKHWIAAAALFGFLGVALGAFGAHALNDLLKENDSVTTWETGNHYLQIHALALLFLSLRMKVSGSGAGGDAGKIALLWVGGILLFSGSLFGLALGGPRWLGPVTPLGGMALLAGWLWLALSALFQKE